MNIPFDLARHREYTYHFFFHDGLFEYIQQIRDYVAAVERQFKAAFEAAEQDPDKESFDPRFSPDTQYNGLFPDMLWRTTFLHSYFFLESALNEICNNVQLAEGIVTGLEDMKGSGIQRAELYLSKVVKVNQPFETDTWKKLQDIRSLRNIFVHAEGNVKPGNKKVFVYAGNYSGLSVIPSFFENGLNMLDINKEFVEEVLDTIEAFFEDVSRHLGQSSN